MSVKLIPDPENERNIKISTHSVRFSSSEDTYIISSLDLSCLEFPYFEVTIRKKPEDSYIGIGLAEKDSKGFPGWASQSYALHGKKKRKRSLIKEIFFISHTF